MFRLRSFFGALGAPFAAARLRRRLLVPVVAVGVASSSCLLLAAGAQARFLLEPNTTPSCTDTFSAADSGDDWDTPGAWSSGTPTSSTIACWASGVTVVVAAADTADSIQGGTLEITGGTLNLADASDNSTVGNVTLSSSGTLRGLSPLTINGAFTWTGQGVLDADITQNDGSGTCFTLDGNGQAYFTGGSVSTSCQVTIDDPGTINTGGATVTTTSTIDFGSGVIVGQGGATFTAAGIVAPSSGSYGFSGDAVDLTAGTTTVPAGTTLETGPLTVENGQTATMAANGEIEELAGPGQIESGGTITGGGTFNNNGGTMTVDSNGTLKSGIAVTGGTFNTDSGSTVGTSTSTLSVTNGEFDNVGAATVGSVTLTGGQFFGTAQLSVEGSFTWTGQAQLNADIVQTDGSGTCFTLNGNGQAYLTGGSVTTSCQVSIDDPGTINTGGATVTTTSTIDFGSGVIVGQGGSTFTAAGIVGPSSGSYGFSADAVDLTSGTTSITAGTTFETGPLTVENGQTATIASGGEIEVLAGPGEVQSGGTITGAGALDNTGGTLTVESGGSVESGVEVSGGTFTTESGSTVGTSTSSLKVDGGQYDNLGAATAGNVTLTGGQFFGTAQLSVEGSFTWTGQAQLNADIVQTDGSGTCFTLNGNGQAYLTGGSVTTSCQVSIDDPGTINTGGATVTTTSTIDFGSGVIVGQGGSTFTAAGIVGPSSGSYGFSADAVDLTGGTTSVTSGTTLETGSLSVAGSNTVLRDDGTLDGAVTLMSGGTLGGTGVAAGAVTNTSGVVAPGDAGVGTLVLDDGYQQGSSGALVDPIAGTGSGDYSTLSVEGSVMLAGALDAEPTNGYAASASETDSFNVIGYTTGLTGMFSTVSSSPALHNGELLNAVYDGSDKLVKLVVGAPAPPQNSGAPAITGTAQVGDTLTCNPGTWSESPTFTYAWDSNGSPIANAGGTTYRVQPGDIGATLTCVVTASVDSSQAQATSPGVLISAPNNSALPTITGTAQPGNTLTCHPGSWTENPTFTYQWERNGSAISAATSSSYGVAGGDVGATLTCVVTATVGSSHVQGTSAGVLVSPTPAPQAPQPTAPPSVTGTPLPGNTLTCDPGTWTGSPAFAYQWEHNSSPIVGANAGTYIVTISDEGMTISCVVTASSGSAQTQASATAVTVAIQGTLTCPQPTGSISGTALGAWRLGMTKAQARRVSKFYTVTKFGFDRFCMYGGWGVRTGYASSLLVQKLPRAHARALVGKVVMILAANTHYAVDGISPGTAIAAIPHTVKLSKPFKIGLNTWYLIRGNTTTGVLKVAGGVAQEVGIANRQLTSGSTASQRTFLSTFRQG